tara:strand:+ start:674 stop:1198 length:525 start_codon:yes stop_codon:yes gene_type:complete
MKLKQLIDETNCILNDQASINIDKLKKLYSNPIDDWQNYIILKENYTRSLVHKNDNFQLIIMTWPGNFESFIHDHNNNECLFKVLKGKFTEFIYQQKDDKLELTNSRKIVTNQIGNINDDYGYHSVKNDTSNYAVSIHLYVKTKQTLDIDQVNIFILDDKMNFNKKTIYLKYDN